MKILQINTIINSGSTGRIAEDIGKVFLANGHDSFIAHGRRTRSSASHRVQIGDKSDIFLHAMKSLFLDRHGFGSKHATRSLVAKIDSINPDIIGLHNLHGYYLNVEILFSYLKEKQVPVIWTLHDCWPFTGHCAHFDFVGCKKWQTHCERCPLTKRYPKSLGYDNSWKNFEDKRRIFTGLRNLTIVTPSQWLKRQVAQSFLNEYRKEVIPNGVDLGVFKILPSERNGKEGEKIILGVASVWDRIKGLTDFIKLRQILSGDYKIVLIGLSKAQIKSLPAGVTGLERTENVEELVRWYNRADVFVNPTYVDNFPTTNLEALACGTPVITYNTGGSPEALDEHTGCVIPKGDVGGIASAIDSIVANCMIYNKASCRKRAELFFNKTERFKEYFDLYQTVLNNE